MKLRSHLVQRLRRLPPPLTRDLGVERDLPVPMSDGAVLLTDHWAPRSGADGLPTALIRTPYGRAGLMDDVVARPLAERGFQVLIQSTRGTFGSGGVFDPLRAEREDGLDTLDWVIKQPWFGDSIVLYGPSYMGQVQWAIADRLPPQVKAMIPSISEAALTREFLRQDGFSLEVPFRWASRSPCRNAAGPYCACFCKAEDTNEPCSHCRSTRRTSPPSVTAPTTFRTFSLMTPTRRTGRGSTI